MSISSKIAGIGVLLVATLLLRQSFQHSFPETMHMVLTRDPPIVGHPHYGRPENP
jgi:hypothetical protein